jgi:hypothetical protein
MIRIKSERILF